MINIDYIMSLLDWNNSLNEQIDGIIMAEQVECINVFLRPCNRKYNKNVWDNCAKILVKKTDEELSPYLVELLQWLQDLNWPGAFCILDRLQKYEEDSSYNLAFNMCLKYAQVMKDDVWEKNLKIIKRKNS